MSEHLLLGSSTQLKDHRAELLRAEKQDLRAADIECPRPGETVKWGFLASQKTVLGHQTFCTGGWGLQQKMRDGTSDVTVLTFSWES